jgi:Mg-chelatase subunit ChlD
MDHLLNCLFIQTMKELTFNQWQEHLAKELQNNYRKLKLIKDEKLQKVSRRKSTSISRV